MTAHYPRDDSGVSSVVAAALVFSLFVTATLLWGINTLPGIVADRERVHQDDVTESMSALQTGLDRLSAGGDEGPIKVAVRLGTDPVPLIQPVPSSGEIQYRSGFNVTATFNQSTLYLVSGDLQGTPDVVANETIRNVTMLQQLRVAFKSNNVTGGAITDFVWVEAFASDGTTNVSARVQHIGYGATCQGPEVQVLVDNGLISRTKTLLCQQNVGENELKNFEFDVMRDAPGFAAGVAGLEPGWTLTVYDNATNAFGNATFQAIWTDLDDRLRVLGGGLVDNDFGVTRRGGHLVYEPSNQRYVDQWLTWEGGGVLARQSDGVGMVADPAFSLDQDDDNQTGFLRWTLVQLSGAGSLAGRGTAAVEVIHESTRDIILTTDTVTFQVDSFNAQGWHKFFSDRARSSDMRGNVTLAPAWDKPEDVDGTVDLTLNKEKNRTWVVQLRIIQARVEVQ